MTQQEPVTLTELEGATLSVINGFGTCTAYQVRQNFKASRSREWSGSAGAVYPALRRMHEAGLLSANELLDARKTVQYSLSESGQRAYEAWLTDVERACGSGLDPFRCRAGSWQELPDDRRAALTHDLISKLEEKCRHLQHLLTCADTPEPVAAVLELALCETRLNWLRANAIQFEP